ncbi:threonine ammonia-lyase, biosynthetic [Algisphaera agarilytica]|uniref:L-threonine dehydratase n=1 Tax=Algisphaera agarilytica TaxID=1385975 RepID=A0A7X0LLA0_9BACT|nr:threonine ammonia-lyase, biosynthetic [Algisphaera agarilytica]MBB6431280.1 threonine dehydratase [Algisphaera agarilytica]
MSSESLRQQLFNEILLARQRVYAVREPTPLERLDIGTDAEVWVKREDQPPIHAYKWRGAYNNMATLSEEQRQRGVVCASAGNHAQGVALAAAKLGCSATVFMPRPTPMMKRKAVALHGGDHVTVELVGDTYDQAYHAARDYAAEHGLAFVHPYDDLATMGGQGTLADEVVMSGTGPFDVAYVQIGGGGMAAAVACWLKHYMPGIRVVGVEAEGQASMKAAVAHGGPVELESLDIFCDGTAVQRAGDLTFELCRELIDEFITVSNAEVCNAIRRFWNWRRRIVEPAGALGLAGLLSQQDRLSGKRALAITCGANLDFSQLAVIAADTGIGGQVRRHLRFRIDESPGALLGLLRDVLGGCNIVEFLYGKARAEYAEPVIGLDASDEVLQTVMQRCAAVGMPVTDITDGEDVDFRVINYDASLFHQPLLLRYEFPERAGALNEFLETIQPRANVCYFNYLYSGERVGRALVGLEFDTDGDRQAFLELLDEHPVLRLRHRVLSAETTQRMLGLPTGGQ